MSSDVYAGALAQRHVTTTYLEHPSERQNEARASAYEEDGSDVEAKRNGSIG
jgi:hypothetical protein